MAISKRVSFFKLILENKNTDSYYEKDDVEKRFQSIYNNKMSKTPCGNRVIKTGKDEKYIVEVISYDNHKAFMTIGVENLPNTMNLRNTDSLVSERLPIKDGQILELFTYCLLDFETDIITYICLNGMTSISALRDLFSDIDCRIIASLVPIVPKDVLRKIVSKDIVSNFTIKIATPCDRILSQEFGLPIEKFAALKNIKTQNITLQISAKRNNSLFAKGNSCLDFFNNLLSSLKKGDNLRKLNVSARNNDETTHSYSLMVERFSKTINFNKEDLESYQSEDFFKTLYDTYEGLKDEIVAYTR